MRKINNFRRGNELYLDKKYLEALSYYIMSIETEDMKEVALYNVGTCYLKLKKYEKAIEYYKKVLEMNSYHQKAHFNLAVSYSHINSSKGAYRHFNIALALDNSDKECKKAIRILEKEKLVCR
ncbi:hypothetical protein CPJCM30710_25440 [Clostridium polyendosporum]|uniref:Tetratricopeptide repeat protein n=1 Tax=Clostridium polyendosporum TaxID=69208 RepID=A0A919S258_9CLOT|nr:tetratricopeptide repeat protein [Clostridium polyendosporum]GIM29878.1 hypothetical protein CPJCM30710_25440 [Clostridium polyendosporum]